MDREQRGHSAGCEDWPRKHNSRFRRCEQERALLFPHRGRSGPTHQVPGYFGGIVYVYPVVPKRFGQSRETIQGQDRQIPGFYRCRDHDCLQFKMFALRPPHNDPKEGSYGHDAVP